MMPAIMAETEETRYGRVVDSKLLVRFFRYAKPYRGWIMAALLLLPASTLLQLLQPLLIQRAVDQHFVPGVLQGFFGLLLLFFGLILCQFVVGYVQSTINTLLGQRIVRDMRTELFAHLLKMDASYYSRTSSGRLTNRITNDTEAVSQMVSAGMINIVGDVLLLLGIGISMVLLSPKLSLIALIAIPFIIVGTLYITKHMRQIQREGRVLQSRMAGRLTEEVEGREVLRLFQCHEKSRRDFDTINRSYLKIVLKSNFLESVQFSFIDTASTLVIAFLFWYGGFIQESTHISIGVVVAFIDYIRRIFFPIRDLSGKFTTIQAAMTALERIFDLLDTVPSIVDTHPVNSPSSTQAPNSNIRGEIRFVNLSFDYGKGPVLQNIHCHIQPGERVAIVGPTGSGKTSLIKLLNRTYEPQQGWVEIDQQPLKHIPLNHLRGMVGVVQQETFLFAGSLWDNIGLMDESISKDQMRQAAKDSGALIFIEQLHQGFDTLLAERGANLSLGQRQLLGITRVLAFNPRILVMDEATSSVDTISERLIQEALERLLEQRTSLIIAHRLSTILHADRILVLSQGVIIEEGNHDQLLQKKGLYAQLYTLQFQT